jgi:hypothetical protein
MMETNMRESRLKTITRRNFVRSTLIGSSCTLLGPAIGTIGLADLAMARPGGGKTAIGVNVGYGFRATDASTDVKAFEQVIGRQVDYLSDFGAQLSWREAVTSAAHAMRVWREVSLSTRRKLLWHQPLTMRGTPLADIASGRHDNSFVAIATSVRNAGFYDAIINLGWDMNGDWTPWAVGPETKDTYIAAYRRIGAIFKKVSPSFKLCWSPSRHEQPMAPYEAYPGDDHVDLIGMSLQIVLPPAGQITPEYFETSIIGHGAVPIAGRQPFALEWLAEFAKLHGKPIALPEIAIGVELANGQDANTPADDAVIVPRIAEWIARNDVVVHFWRDMANSESNPLHSRFSRSSIITGSKPVSLADERPLLATAYRKAWGSNS